MSEQLTRGRNEMTNIVIAGKACTTSSEDTDSTDGTVIVVGSIFSLSNRLNNSRDWISPYILKQFS